VKIKPTSSNQPEWAMLLFELPASLSNLRVKIWRRLQKVGALNLKGGTYALPRGAETEEDFEWLRQTIVDGGGEALILYGRARNSQDHQDVIRRFQELRAYDYKELIRNLARVKAKSIGSASGNARISPSETLREFAESVKHHQERLLEIQKTDFFPTRQSEEAKQAMESVKRELKIRSEGKSTATMLPGKKDRKAYQGKTWVTRKNMHVDRLASAWLILNFIDPKARFRFVADKSAKSAAMLGIPFDMAEAEFGHHGDDCSFETLINAFGLTKDASLKSLSEIVHDIDIKDGKFGRLEAAGIDLSIKSLRNECRSDAKLLKEGSRFFSALYGGLKS
jgi:hypothetical protein